MNKTFTINLAGQLFNINEDAYNNLLAYFNSLEKFYANEEGKDDIITDIKSRFAELFLAKGKNYIITQDDANEVINMMGKPQEFDEENSEKTTTENNNYTSPNSFITGKRLYRDVNNNVVAGVCAGLSAYFGIKDPIWIRLLFIIVVFIGFGSPFLVYIILWIVMPEAQTAAQKLEMKGEPINLSSIENKIKNESTFLNNSEQQKGFINQLVAFVGNCVKFFFKFLLGIGAIVLILVGVSLLIAFLALIFALGVGLLFGTPIASRYFFDENIYAWLISIGGILTATIPFILIIIGLVHILSKKSKPFKKQIVLPLFGLFMFGLLLLNMSFRNGKKLIQEHKKITQHVPVNFSTKLDTVELAMAYSDKKESDMNLSFNSFSDFFKFLSKDHEINIPVSIEIYPTNADSLSIVKEFSAQGSTEKEALQNATSITHNFMQKNNQFIIDPFILFNTANKKFRNQKLTLKIFVPEGQIIRWNEKVEDYLDENNLPINWNATSKSNTAKNLKDKQQVELNINNPNDTTNVKIDIKSNNPKVQKAIEKMKEELEDEFEDSDNDFFEREHYLFKMQNGELIPLD